MRKTLLRNSTEVITESKRRKSVISNILKQQKPNNTTVLREYDAKLKNGLIKIKKTMNSHSVCKNSCSGK